MFKVVPDQLRISDGWVRCGQCNEIFDANSHLRHALPAADQPVAQHSPAAAVVASKALDLQFPPAESVETPVLDGWDSSVASEVEVSIAPAPLDRFDNEHLEPHSLPQTIAQSDVKQGSDEAISPAIKRAPSSEPPASTLGDYAPHSFMRKSSRESVWNSRAVRVVLILLSLGLVGVLTLQILVFERDRIAAIEPSALAILEPLCTVLGCSIGPLRQIESVVIDSSSFTKIRGDTYRLGLSLKNTAPLRIATPAIELTLTDLQDRAVLRRVLSATEMGLATATALEPGIEMPVNVSLNLKMPAQAEKISGYRLLSFYP